MAQENFLYEWDSLNDKLDLLFLVENDNKQFQQISRSISGKVLREMLREET